MAKIGLNMVICKIGLISKHRFVFCSLSHGTFDMKVISNFYPSVKKFQCVGFDKIEFNMEPNVTGRAFRF